MSLADLTKNRQDRFFRPVFFMGLILGSTGSLLQPTMIDRVQEDGCQYQWQQLTVLAIDNRQDVFFDTMPDRLTDESFNNFPQRKKPDLEMKFDPVALIIRADEAEGVTAIAIHVTIGDRNPPFAHGNGYLVHRHCSSTC